MASKFILLIEDDLNLRQSITLVLHRAGYLVTATDCAPEALDIASSGNYNLVILDSDMPETRKMVLPRFARCFPAIPIVVLIDQPLFDDKLTDAGSSITFLSKPVAPEDLLEKVKLIME